MQEEIKSSDGNNLNERDEGLQQAPVQVSSASSLDSFFMEINANSDFHIDSNNNSYTYVMESNNNSNNDSNSTNPKRIESSTQQIVTNDTQQQQQQQQQTNDNSLAHVNNDGSESQQQQSQQQQLQQPQQQQQQQLAAAVPSTLVSDPLASSSNIHNSLILSQQKQPTTSMTVNNSIPEFLFQLTKMLSDNNSDVIEWANGRIEVHSPHKMESHVLKKYFRHNKFASFQRQLNYFGFRKLAGKGKMAPCSYVNEAAGDDVTSLLLIKRKTGPGLTTPKESSSKKRRESTIRPLPKSVDETNPQVNPVLAGIYQQESQNQPDVTFDLKKVKSEEDELGGSGYRALAKRAVGKGVRHNFAASAVPPQHSQPRAPQEVAAAYQDTNSSLSELALNYHKSCGHNSSDSDAAAVAAADALGSAADPTPLSQLRSENPDNSESMFTGFLSRNSSLIDLAMIAPVDDETDDTSGFGFIDFPNPEVLPSSMRRDQLDQGEI